MPVALKLGFVVQTETLNVERETLNKKCSGGMFFLLFQTFLAASLMVFELSLGD